MYVSFLPCVLHSQPITSTVKESINPILSEVSYPLVTAGVTAAEA